MGFTIDTSVPILTVFIQGLLSFFSPCVFPLVPLYISYLSGGAKTIAPDGTIFYPRKKIMVNTIAFVLGISFTFFVLGLGVQALGVFFQDNRLLFARVSGIIMVFFGLYQLGAFGASMVIEKEHRLPFRLHSLAMGPLPAFLLGFTFSFAWTPCVGPILGSVLLMASTAGSATAGFSLISIFTLGFVLPFLAVGLFTQQVLGFFKGHQNVVRYTVKIGAILLILMGIMTFSGFLNSFTNYLTAGTPQSVQTTPTEPSEPNETVAPNAPTEEESIVPALDFTLLDQNGVSHTLSDYKGKTVFLNFWGTWCPPCRHEMPAIQNLYEDYGSNEGDVIILGIAAPNSSREGDTAHIQEFLETEGYTYPTVMDEDTSIFFSYGITSFPTTFMIDTEGNIYGYINGALTKDTMVSIIQQTIDGK